MASGERSLASKPFEPVFRDRAGVKRRAAGGDRDAVELVEIEGQLEREPHVELVPAVVAAMKGPYPDLVETAQRVASVIEKEEANFFGTIDAGMNRIERAFDDMRKENRTRVEGAVAAELYQTYGVPPELFESPMRLAAYVQQRLA